MVEVAEYMANLERIRELKAEHEYRRPVRWFDINESDALAAMKARLLAKKQKVL